MTSLAAIAQIADFNPPTPRISDGDEEVAFVPMAAVSETGRMSAVERKRASELNNGYSYFQSGDVLVAKITPCFENNKIAVAEIDQPHGFGSTEFHVIRPHTSVLDARYLVHFLRQDSVRDAGTRRMTGSAGQRRVPRTFLEELEIPLPPIDEQKRIAAILDQADALRRKRREALEQLTSLKDAIFFDVFVRNESDTWPTKTIAQIATNTRTGPFGSHLLHSEFVDEGIAVLGIDNAVNNEFRWDERRFITPEKYQALRRYAVLPGDVLITIMGTCGRCAIVPDDIPTAINTKHLCCITLDQSQAIPEFVHVAFLQHPAILRQLGLEAKGAVMPGLNMGIIRALEFPIPPLKLQYEFARRINIANGMQEQFREHAQQLDSLFASLQHRAFRGEL